MELLHWITSIFLVSRGVWREVRGNEFHFFYFRISIITANTAIYVIIFKLYIQGAILKFKRYVLLLSFVFAFNLLSANEIKSSFLNNLYFGIGFGDYKVSVANSNEDLKKSTTTLIAGYNVNRYVAIEGRYSFSLGNSTLYVLQNTKPTKTKFSNLSIFTKLSYPIDTFKPYLLIGYGKTKLTNIVKSNRVEYSIEYGIGANYVLNNNLELFTEYVRLYNHKGFDGRAKSSKVKISLFSAGIKYNF